MDAGERLSQPGASEQHQTMVRTNKYAGVDSQSSRHPTKHLGLCSVAEDSLLPTLGPVLIKILQAVEFIAFKLQEILRPVS